MFAFSILSRLHVELACTACIDRATQIQYPFAVPLAAVAVLWMLAVTLLRRRSNRMTQSTLPLASRAVKRFASWGAIGLCLSSLFVLSQTWALLFSMSWITYLAWRLCGSVFQRSADKSERRLLVVNVMAFVIALVVTQAACTYARSTRGIVGLLGSPGCFGAHLMHRELIQVLLDRERSCVPVLNNAFANEFRSGPHPNISRAIQIAFCLGRIGGEDAEHILDSILKLHGEFETEKYASNDWRIATMCAYVDCAGARSVPRMMSLLESDTEEQRIAALCALARSGSREGIEAAFLHMPELIEFGSREKGVWYSRGLTGIAGITAWTLMRGDSPEQLRSLQVFRRLIGGLDERLLGQKVEFADMDSINLSGLQEEWDRDHTAISDRWANALE